ncbi:unnamed protein product [Effrenium voratum]|nr:unnamed protein product [Effrenium voratum]|mmetsp:Transcript_93095/g.221409  ORF Transcript_93095/g.221409 Transcript_93095/m.221409 type:complete len:345 (+) Transcript_93095:58-1092(+)
MCFLIGATGPGVTATGEALLGCVSDDPYLFRTFVRVVQPAGGRYPHVGTELVYATEQPDLAPPFQVEPGETSRGVNSQGLAFVIALAVEQEAPQAEEGDLPPVRFCELSRKMMNECSDVEGALKLLQAQHAVAPALSVLLADASGGLAHVEVGSHGTAVHQRFTKDHPGMALAVNCYQSKELKGFNEAKAELSVSENNNGCRLLRGQDLARQLGGNLDVAAFRGILSDHGNRERDPADNPLLKWWGYSICNHGTRRSDAYDANAAPWGTVSAEVLQPSKRALHYNYGWACGERAEFGDQLFQDNSWAHFASFVPTAAPEARTVACTTVDGQMCPEASLFQLHSD